MSHSESTLVDLVAKYDRSEARAVHARLGLAPPLPVAEHLALLASGEAVVRRVLQARQSQVDEALRAGATWAAVAAATGTTVHHARRDFRRWERGQTALGKAIGSSAPGSPVTPACPRPGAQALRETP